MQFSVSDVLPATVGGAPAVYPSLLSNCVANTGHLLASLGLSTAVDLTVLSGNVDSVKPEPEIYLRAAAACEVEPMGGVVHQ